MWHWHSDVRGQCAINTHAWSLGNTYQIARFVERVQELDPDIVFVDADQFMNLYKENVPAGDYTVTGPSNYPAADYSGLDQNYIRADKVWAAFDSASTETEWDFSQLPDEKLGAYNPDAYLDLLGWDTWIWGVSEDNAYGGICWDSKAVILGGSDYRGGLWTNYPHLRGVPNAVMYNKITIPEDQRYLKIRYRLTEESTLAQLRVRAVVDNGSGPEWMTLQEYVRVEPSEDWQELTADVSSLAGKEAVILIEQDFFNGQSYCNLGVSRVSFTNEGIQRLENGLTQQDVESKALSEKTEWTAAIGEENPLTEWTLKDVNIYGGAHYGGRFEFFEETGEILLESDPWLGLDAGVQAYFYNKVQLPEGAGLFYVRAILVWSDRSRKF